MVITALTRNQVNPQGSEGSNPSRSANKNELNRKVLAHFLFSMVYRVMRARRVRRSRQKAAIGFLDGEVSSKVVISGTTRSGRNNADAEYPSRSANKNELNRKVLARFLNTVISTNQYDSNGAEPSSVPFSIETTSTVYPPPFSLGTNTLSPFFLPKIA